MINEGHFSVIAIKLFQLFNGKRLEKTILITERFNSSLKTLQ